MTHTHAYTHTSNTVATIIHHARNVVVHATTPMQRPMLALPISQDAIGTKLLPSSQAMYDQGWIAALLECEPSAFVTKELAKPCTIWDAIAALDTDPMAVILFQGLAVTHIELVGDDQFEIGVVNPENYYIDTWVLSAYEALQADIRVVVGGVC